MHVGLLEHVITPGPVCALVLGLHPPYASQRCSRPTTKHISRRYVTRLLQANPFPLVVLTGIPDATQATGSGRMRPRFACLTGRFQTHRTALCNAGLRLRAIFARQNACGAHEGRGGADTSPMGCPPASVRVLRDFATTTPRVEA